MCRPQLSTYSKAILLMHRIEYVCNRPRNSKLSALEFLKYLVVEHFGYEILTTTKFNTLCSAEHSIPEPKDSTNYVLIKQYCELELQRIQPNFDATLRFIIEMDPLKWDDDDKSDDESTEDESDHEWDWR
ncbi:hypothetical protein M3Y98_00206100 [Aphelenchoides besseyi]|nr:hypothetical protein M3Y98_00206100 [Aphelenchoides besseyi]